MLNLEQDVFLQLTSESRRLLHPSKVVSVNSHAFNVMLEENLTSLEIAGEALYLQKDQETE